MSALLYPILNPNQNSPLGRHWSVAEYQRQIDLGLLTDEDKVELLEGGVVDKIPINPPHDSSVTRLNRRLSRLVPDAFLVRCQNTLELFQSRPEPDFAIVRGDETDFDSVHPGPTDVVFVIEVSDSSLERDRTQKNRIYSQAGIQVYWVVNLIEGQIEVYTEPGEEAYRSRKDFLCGQAVPVELDGTLLGTVSVGEVIPEGQ